MINMNHTRQIEALHAENEIEAEKRQNTIIKLERFAKILKFYYVQCFLPIVSMMEAHCEEARLSQRHLNNEIQKLSEVCFLFFS